MSKLDLARAAIPALDACQAKGGAKTAFPELARRLRSLAEAEVAREPVSREVTIVTKDDFVVTVLGLPADWGWTVRELECVPNHWAHERTTRNKSKVPTAETTMEPRQPSLDE